MVTTATLLAVMMLSIPNAIANTYGAGAHSTSILVSEPFAVARGVQRGKPFHVGLTRRGSDWHISCVLPEGGASASLLRKKCGFSQHAATRLSLDDLANAAATQGDFKTASADTRAALATARPQERPADSARLALLNKLSLQIATGQITRADAIRKWNEVQISIFMP